MAYDHLSVSCSLRSDGYCSMYATTLLHHFWAARYTRMLPSVLAAGNVALDPGGRDRLIQAAGRVQLWIRPEEGSRIASTQSASPAHMQRPRNGSGTTMATTHSSTEKRTRCCAPAGTPAFVGEPSAQINLSKFLDADGGGAFHWDTKDDRGFKRKNATPDENERRAIEIPRTNVVFALFSTDFHLHRLVG